MADVLAPLYKLPHKDGNVLMLFKHLTSNSNSLLVHFNPDLDLVFMCVAFSYGIGDVLAHHMPDDSEQPIGYTSRSLSTA